MQSQTLMSEYLSSKNGQFDRQRCLSAAPDGPQPTQHHCEENRRVIFFIYFVVLNVFCIIF